MNATVPVGAEALNSEYWAFNSEPGNVEPNAAGVNDRMLSIDDAVKALARREDDREDFIAGDSKSLSLDWVPSDQDIHKRGGVYLMKHPEFGSEGMEVDSTAIKAACNMMGITPTYFQNFPDSQRKFVKDFGSFLDHKGHGCILRTGTNRDGLTRRVESIVPSNFDRTSDAQILGAMLLRLNADYKDRIRGVQVLGDGDRGTYNYRILFGNTMMHEDPRDPTKAVLPMLSFMSSELGLAETRVALGLYRIHCRNGMMRVDWEGGIAKWKRKNSPNGFLGKVGEVIGNVGHFATAVTDTLGSRLGQPLAAPAIEILASLGNRNLIAQKHFQAAERAVAYSPAATEYDMLNILTDTAKQMNPLQARQEAESTALRLAMQPNGFSGIYLEGFNKDFARAQAKSKNLVG
jgi:hypothetical protein